MTPADCGEPSPLFTSTPPPSSTSEGGTYGRSCSLKAEPPNGFASAATVRNFLGIWCRVCLPRSIFLPNSDISSVSTFEVSNSHGPGLPHHPNVHRHTRTWQHLGNSSWILVGRPSSQALGRHPLPFMPSALVEDPLSATWSAELPFLTSFSNSKLQIGPGPHQILYP
jgi:hypothetical protein